MRNGLSNSGDESGAEFDTDGNNHRPWAVYDRICRQKTARKRGMACRLNPSVGLVHWNNFTNNSLFATTVVNIQSIDVYAMLTTLT